MDELMPLIERLAEINGNLGGLLSILILIVALSLAIPLIPMAVSRLRSRLRSREPAEEHPALIASRAVYAERCRRYGYAPVYAYYYREGATTLPRRRKRGW